MDFSIRLLTLSCLLTLYVGVLFVPSVYAIDPSHRFLGSSISLKSMDTDSNFTLRSSINQYGITFEFDKNYPTGQFANGDWWVLGPVTITHISPEFTGASHGFEIDPQIGNSQGFDHRGDGFNSTLVPSLPITLDPAATGINASSVVKAISRPASEAAQNQRCGQNGSDRGCLKTVSVLTVLAKAPEVNSETLFRPQYVRATQGDKFLFSTLDLDLSLLPALPVPTGAPSPDYVVARFNQARLDHMATIFHNQYIHPKDYMSSYGTGITREVGKAAIVLGLDYSIASKRPAAIAYVQHAIDLYGMLLEGQTWEANGGHGSGRKLPILLAGQLLGDAGMLNIGQAYPASTDTFAEDGQTFFSTENPPFSEAPNTGCYQPLPAEYGPSYARYGIRHWSYPNQPHMHGENSICEGSKSNYWSTNASSWVGEVMAAHIHGLVEAWNHPAFFEHQDRYVEMNGFFGGHGDSFNNQIWTLYREEFQEPSREACRGDLDGDGRVGQLDITFLLSSWGKVDPAADLNESGIVDFGDITEMLKLWGPC